MFDEIAVRELRLENPGRVGFEFATLNMESFDTDNCMPGVPVIVPSSGHVNPYSEVVLRVHFLPGVPEKFHKSFEVC